jgi:hypothetical protein
MTEEQRERRREDERFYRDRLRREQGRDDGYRPRGPSKVDGVEQVYLDAEPIQRELRSRVGQWREIARRTGIDERAIFRWVSGESRHIRLDLADRLAFAFGIPLYLLYGDQPLYTMRGRKIGTAA